MESSKAPPKDMTFCSKYSIKVITCCAHGVIVICFSMRNLEGEGSETTYINLQSSNFAREVDCGTVKLRSKGQPVNF